MKKSILLIISTVLFLSNNISIFGQNSSVGSDPEYQTKRAEIINDYKKYSVMRKKLEKNIKTTEYFKLTFLMAEEATKLGQLDKENNAPEEKYKKSLNTALDILKEYQANANLSSESNAYQRIQAKIEEIEALMVPAETKAQEMTGVSKENEEGKKIAEKKKEPASHDKDKITIKAGFKLGGGPSGVSDSDASSSFGFSAGLVFDVKFLSLSMFDFSFAPAILYQNMKFESEWFISDFNAANGGINSLTGMPVYGSEIKLDFISIPLDLLIKFNMESLPVTPYAIVGLNISLVQSSNYKYKDPALDYQNLKAEYIHKSSTTALDLGIGAEMDLMADLTAFFEFSFKIGLSKLTEDHVGGEIDKETGKTNYFFYTMDAKEFTMNIFVGAKYRLFDL